LKPGTTYSIGVLSKTSSYGQTNRIYVATLSTPADTDIVEYYPAMTPETQISDESDGSSSMEED